MDGGVSLVRFVSGKGPLLLIIAGDPVRCKSVYVMFPDAGILIAMMMNMHELQKEVIVVLPLSFRGDA